MFSLEVPMKSSRRRCLQVVCCTVSLLVADRAAAEISIKLSNQQLTAQSDVIVIGRAIDSASRWANRILVTAVRVQVREALKGGGSGVMEVLLPGGIDLTRKAPVSMTFPGAPRIQRNEDVLLFLTRNAGLGGYIVTGFAQGKFSIVMQQGRQMISRNLSGSQLALGNNLSRGVATLTPLADFRQEIASYIVR
jgi:hypothetical protein